MLGAQHYWPLLLTACLLCRDFGDDSLIALWVQGHRDDVTGLQVAESAPFAVTRDGGISRYLMEELVLASYSPHRQLAVAGRDDLALVGANSKGRYAQEESQRGDDHG